MKDMVSPHNRRKRRRANTPFVPSLSWKADVVLGHRRTGKFPPTAFAICLMYMHSVPQKDTAACLVSLPPASTPLPIQNITHLYAQHPIYQHTHATCDATAHPKYHPIYQHAHAACDAAAHPNTTLHQPRSSSISEALQEDVWEVVGMSGIVRWTMALQGWWHCLGRGCGCHKMSSGSVVRQVAVLGDMQAAGPRTKALQYHWLHDRQR